MLARLLYDTLVAGKMSGIQAFSQASIRRVSLKKVYSCLIRGGSTAPVNLTPYDAADRGPCPAAWPAVQQAEA